MAGRKSIGRGTVNTRGQIFSIAKLRAGYSCQPFPQKKAEQEIEHPRAESIRKQSIQLSEPNNLLVPFLAATFP